MFARVSHHYCQKRICLTLDHHKNVESPTSSPLTPPCEQFKSLPEVSGAMALFQESFVKVQDTLVTVAHMVIPPPGGQIVAAAFVVAGMIIKVWSWL